MKFSSRRLLSLNVLILFLAIPLFGQRTARHVDPETSEAALAGARVDTLAGQPASDSDYIIGNGDQLSINVWKEPNLTQKLPVMPDGKITLPLIGDVQASGRTTHQLQEAVTAKLRVYMTDPQVTVMVTQINSKKFNILGRVAKPGAYPLTTITTVLDAIAEAGGFQDFAKTTKIYILRKKPNGGETRMAFNYKDVIRGKNPEENIRLQAGDTVVVP